MREIDLLIGERAGRAHENCVWRRRYDLPAIVQEWDKAITGDMGKTLAQVKLRAMGYGSRRDAYKATTFNLASFASKCLRWDSKQ